ncbi:MAG: hypothetical protein IPI67_37985 [Myxococcales bacterium]|nr:hypothetical protein [Myxococcales bacterium]
MARIARIWVAGVFLAVLGASCGDNAKEPGPGGVGGTSPLDGSAEADAAICATEQWDLIAFVKANKACTADADCVFVPVRSVVREVCPSPSEEADAAGGFYLNAAHDQVELDTLAKALDACLPPPPPYACGISPSPPVCWHGQCFGKFDVESKTPCLADLGGENACTQCACGTCIYDCQGLLERPVVLCAIKAGCLGTAQCDPFSPDFPCKKEMAETGGGTYRYCNNCIADWQCAADCAAGK